MKHRLKHIFYTLLALVGLLVLIYLNGPWPHFEAFDGSPEMEIPPLAGLAAQIAAQEAAVAKLRPDNEARIVWADSVRKTPCSVVYLHGFSASQFEGSPIHERFAQRYGCNLYLARLAGHGIDEPDAFRGLEPKALVESAKQAIAIGKA
ncbi:MAG: alpha/beta hydrolase, partial [Bacteroidetes bacterium]